MFSCNKAVPFSGDGFVVSFFLAWNYAVADTAKLPVSLTAAPPNFKKSLFFGLDSPPFEAGMNCV